MSEHRLRFERVTHPVARFSFWLIPLVVAAIFLTRNHVFIYLFGMTTFAGTVLCLMRAESGPVWAYLKKASCLLFVIVVLAFDVVGVWHLKLQRFSHASVATVTQVLDKRTTISSSGGGRGATTTHTRFESLCRYEVVESGIVYPRESWISSHSIGDRIPVVWMDSPSDFEMKKGDFEIVALGCVLLFFNTLSFGFICALMRWDTWRDVLSFGRRRRPICM